VGIPALPGIVGIRLWDELLEKTEAYGPSDTPAARTSVAGRSNAEIRLRSAKCSLALQVCPKNLDTWHASIGRACQGAGFHATFSLAAALCDAVWPN
jgi:hypothetical protein